jgi:hypothetical protein
MRINQMSERATTNSTKYSLTDFRKYQLLRIKY